MAGNLLMSISQDERERAVFRSRRMYETDMESNLATAEDRGIERGIAVGRAERDSEFARSMIANGEPIEKIMRYTGLTREDVENLSAAIR